MRAALPIALVQCMLLAGIAPADEPSPAAPHALPITPNTVTSLGSRLPSRETVDPADLLFAAPTRIDRIGRIIAPVMINGRGPFRFIVDTGANYSTISPQLAAALGLKETADSSILVNGVTGTAQVPSVPISRLQVGDFLVENTQLPVVWAPLMAGADGILGAAGLTEGRLLVDFAHNRVVLSRSREARAPAYFARLPGMRLRGGLVSVEAHVGGVRVDAIIDTGSERTLGNVALQKALFARHSDHKGAKSTKVYGATTYIASGELDVAPTIDLGTVQIAKVTLVFGDLHIFEVWGLTDRPALIVGMDVLGTVAGLGIDFHHAEVYLDAAYSASACRQSSVSAFACG
jgi:predicted aspartyl protease